MLLRHFLSNPQAIGNVLNICEKSTSGQQFSSADFWRVGDVEENNILELYTNLAGNLLHKSDCLWQCL